MQAKCVGDGEDPGNLPVEKSGKPAPFPFPSSSYLLYFPYATLHSTTLHFNHPSIEMCGSFVSFDMYPSFHP